MIFTINHVCGHTRDLDLQGKTIDLDKRAAEIAAQACPECWKAEAAARREKINQYLPDLEGTEKQIAWAMDIRADFFMALDAGETACLANNDNLIWPHIFRDIKQEMGRLTMARFWIDARHKMSPERIAHLVIDYERERHNYYWDLFQRLYHDASPGSLPAPADDRTSGPGGTAAAGRFPGRAGDR